MIQNKSYTNVIDTAVHDYKPNIFLKQFLKRAWTLTLYAGISLM